jgi:NTP pyrophosphatase (non-canonical NTP hydrolase)
MKTLKDYTNEIVETFKGYEKTGTKPWTYKIAAFDMSYQIGSLAKRIAQLDGERHAEGLSQEELKKYAADELADIFAEVLFIAHDLGIDLEQGWEDMKKSDEKKIEERS